MGKPRVLIAESDPEYVAPLVQSFVSRFGDSIVMEVITDGDYFSGLFKDPQKIDVLVVGECFFSEQLSRHNIGKIVEMTEKNDDDDGQTGDILKIFKYTSIKAIFSEILGICEDILNIELEVEKTTQVVAVYSACGGVGKTTLSMAMAGCFSLAHKKVLYIDAEYVQNFDYFLNDKKPLDSSAASLFRVGEKELFTKLRPVIRNELFDYIPPFRLSISSYNINFEVYEFLIELIKKTKLYDFIVVDMDSSFDDEKGKLIDIADKVVIITHQSRYCVYKTNCMLKNINYSDSEKFIFVCNAFQSEYSNALLESANYSNFMINEYVHWIAESEKMGLNELSRIDGVQKICYSMI